MGLAKCDSNLVGIPDIGWEKITKELEFIYYFRSLMWMSRLGELYIYIKKKECWKINQTSSSLLTSLTSRLNCSS